jgi:hypothetical protein
MYAPRVTLSMPSHETLDYYPIPPVPSPWKPKIILVDQLNIFAGQFYFRDNDAYKKVCAFLGLCLGEPSAVVGPQQWICRRVGSEVTWNGTGITIPRKSCSVAEGVGNFQAEGTELDGDGHGACFAWEAGESRKWGFGICRRYDPIRKRNSLV